MCMHALGTQRNRYISSHLFGRSLLSTRYIVLKPPHHLFGWVQEMNPLNELLSHGYNCSFKTGLVGFLGNPCGDAYSKLIQRLYDFSAY